ncbi:uncharacterized protein LOC128673077 isoform X2 [Plodia interpunctella]|uniref:uncharacterized protein LOC128673077 isoform X2 n=1 Tax=Plodia interpunctella TaxID=58824 RepID=UPI002367DF94|nr:uncharacterized protein LOC128673077 isoform X2 [Plodia interpunctella]
MWISAVSRCLIILIHFEITTIAANEGDRVIRLKPHNAIILGSMYDTPKIETESHLDKDVTGYDFTDQEIEKLKLWPRGIIPFYIDTVSYDKVFRDKIRVFLEKVNGLASLQFLELHSPPADDETRFIMFMNRAERNDALDYSPSYFSTRGPQRVRLQYDCFTNGDIYAAILAVVGVPPQHCAPNRDNHIQIKEENILPEKLSAFKKINDDEWLFHDIMYDFMSAGHFDSHKYTKNGLATVEAKVKDAELIPHTKNEFSPKDILKMRYLYNYIGNTEAPVRQLDCNRMFKPGSKFNSFAPSKGKLKRSPRVKPNRYLGLPDEKPSFTEREENGVKEDNDKNEESSIDKSSDVKKGDEMHPEKIPLDDDDESMP